MSKAITVQAEVHSTKAMVWEYWTVPEHISKWAFASDDWEAPVVENDVREGGRFKTRMQAKDGSGGFDFTGAYTEVREGEHLAYIMDDGRKVTVDFVEEGENLIKITQTFEMEEENLEELQRTGWQAILNNFKKCVETR